MEKYIVVRKHHPNRKSMCWEDKAGKSPKDWKSDSFWMCKVVLAPRRAGEHHLICASSVSSPGLHRKPQFPLMTWRDAEAGQFWPVWGSEVLALKEKAPNACVSAQCFQILDSPQRYPRSTRLKSPACAGCRNNSTVPGPNLVIWEVHPPPCSSVPELSTKTRDFSKA